MDQLGLDALLVTLGSETILRYLGGIATLYSKGNVETYPDQTTSAADHVEGFSSEDYPLWIRINQQEAQKLKKGDKIRDRRELQKTYVVREDRRERKNVVASSLSANSVEQSIKLEEFGNYFEICLDGAQQHLRWLNRPLMPGNFGANLNDNYDVFEDATEKGIVRTVEYRNVSDEEFAAIQATTVRGTTKLLSLAIGKVYDTIKCPLVITYYYIWMRHKIDLEFVKGQISSKELMDRHKPYEDCITTGKHFLMGAGMGVSTYIATLELAKKTFGATSYVELVKKIGEKIPIVATIVNYFGGETKFLMAGGLVALMVGGFLNVASNK